MAACLTCGVLFAGALFDRTCSRCAGRNQRDLAALLEPPEIPQPSPTDDAGKREERRPTGAHDHKGAVLHQKPPIYEDHGATVRRRHDRLADERFAEMLAPMLDEGSRERAPVRAGQGSAIVSALPRGPPIGGGGGGGGAAARATLPDSCRDRAAPRRGFMTELSFVDPPPLADRGAWPSLG